MSALKHTIRHQQAQLQNLENHLQRTPRLPLTTNITSPPSSPPLDLSPSDLPPTTPNGKIKRRSSFGVLLSLAGPDSNLPLPRRDPGSLIQDGIREGIPMDFGAGPSSQAYKRQSSPTRTLSRACQCRFHFPRTSLTHLLISASRHTRFLRRFVYITSHACCILFHQLLTMSSPGNARALADDGALSTPPRSNGADALSNSSTLQPPSPSLDVNRRLSLTPGGTTKVLADLQTGVINARNALENTKAQLRLSQRSVAQLTRQTEDLKEVRERLRLENEGLNNVVARKERLLQEVCSLLSLTLTKLPFFF